MSAAWPTARLGEVLSPTIREHTVDPSREYPLLGVRLDGQGPFHRETVLGTQTSASRLYEVRAGDFIYSRLFAWRGAFGLIETELDGYFVSNEFPLFDVATDRLDPLFLSWMSKTASFVELCKRASEGTTNRVRLSDERFKGLEIPLPPLDEQRRIVARIEELAAKLDEARGLRAISSAEIDAHWPATLRLAFNGELVGAVPFKATANQLLAHSAELNADYTEIALNNAYPHKPRILNEGPHTIPTAWCWTTLGSVLTHMVDCVNDTPNFSETYTGLLGLKTTNIRPYRLELQRRWFMTPDDFKSWNRREAPRAGDIVLTLEAPVGNVCMIPEDLSVCLTQRLMLLRPEKAAINALYLLHFLNSPCFTEQIAASGRGQTHPHIRVGDAPQFLLPLPPMEQQKKIVGKLDALQAKADAVKALQTETAAELDAMLPAILDKAFKGEL